MSNEKTDLITRIYDAAANEEFWASALDAVAEAANAKGTALFALDHVGLPFALDKFNSVYSQSEAQYYMEHLLQYDRDGWADMQRAPARSVRMDQDLVADVEGLIQRPDYAWLKQTAGVLRRGGARLNDSPGWTDVITFQFPSTLARIPESMVRDAEAILPHLAKSVELHRSFAILKNQYNAVLSALDYVRIGVCVVGPHGHVVVSNQEAQRIFSLSDGLAVSRDDTLICASGDATGFLKHAIKDVISTGEGMGETPESLVVVERRSGAPPFLIEVAPIRDSAAELQKGLSGAIVFIVDPENPRPVSVQNLVACHGLSQAEAAVCTLMVQGLTALDIAERRSVSPETIKSQINAVYRKTRTTGRAELIRLALNITPPIDTSP